MKVCPLCNRTYANSSVICEHDGQRLILVRRDDPTDAAPTIDWEGPLAGDIVGSYRLESMIAEGGMGRIFRAAHLTLGRTVAIKFLLPEHANRADLVQRFFNEARSVNAIRHPHILEIYDFIQDRQPDGRQLVYMVMEYLDGEDLRMRLARHKQLPASQCAHIGAQVAEALAAAHEENILHRDLKPDNIFLCKRPRDFVKLLDFGAAKAFGERPGHDLTRPGVAIGTPEYMAPEQILNLPLDGRVDAYALGVVLYELLTGGVPFSAAKVGDILAMHTQKEPAPIGAPANAIEAVPRALSAVVMRCLAKRPQSRYANLWEVAEALKTAAGALDTSMTDPAFSPPEFLPDRQPEPNQGGYSVEPPGPCPVESSPATPTHQGLVVAGLTDPDCTLEDARSPADDFATAPFIAPLAHIEPSERETTEGDAPAGVPVHQPAAADARGPEVDPASSAGSQQAAGKSSSGERRPPVTNDENLLQMMVARDPLGPERTSGPAKPAATGSPHRPETRVAAFAGAQWWIAGVIVALASIIVIVILVLTSKP